MFRGSDGSGSYRNQYGTAPHVQDYPIGNHSVFPMSETMLNTVVRHLIPEEIRTKTAEKNASVVRVPLEHIEVQPGTPIFNVCQRRRLQRNKGDPQATLTSETNTLVALPAGHSIHDLIDVELTFIGVTRAVTLSAFAAQAVAGKNSFISIRRDQIVDFLPTPGSNWFATTWRSGMTKIDDERKCLAPGVDLYACSHTQTGLNAYTLKAESCVKPDTPGMGHIASYVAEYLSGDVAGGTDYVRSLLNELQTHIIDAFNALAGEHAHHGKSTERAHGTSALAVPAVSRLDDIGEGDDDDDGGDDDDDDKGDEGDAGQTYLSVEGDRTVTRRSSDAADHQVDVANIMHTLAKIECMCKMLHTSPIARVVSIANDNTVRIRVTGD